MTKVLLIMFLRSIRKSENYRIIDCKKEEDQWVIEIEEVVE